MSVPVSGGRFSLHIFFGGNACQENRPPDTPLLSQLLPLHDHLRPSRTRYHHGKHQAAAHQSSLERPGLFAAVPLPVSNNAHVNYNGKETAVYRGGSDFTVKQGEVRINPETGNVRTTHGISVNADPEAVSRFGGSYRIEYLPEELKIIQRGNNTAHFEIVPSHEMPLEEFQELLNQIVVSGPY